MTVHGSWARLTGGGLLAAAALSLGGCGSATMDSAPHYTTSVLLLPRSNQAQIRQVQLAPNADECFAIATVRSDLKNLRCYDTLTLQLGPSHPRGRWTERYAALQQCIARLTLAQLREGCVHAIQTCTNRCAPGETSRISIEFRTDGKHVEKEWQTCGTVTARVFQLRSGYCGIAKESVPWKRGYVSVGQNYELDIPGVLQRGTYERFNLRPDGALLFANCC